jgi:hypothetical protein
MTLPSSGSLSYNTIRAEFGSPSTNVYLSLYYRGGPYTYPVPANANITTSSTGTIAVNDFYGADNTTDYAAFQGTTYTSGGKAPQTYYGTGAPGNGNGNFIKNTLKIGGTTFTWGGAKDCWAVNNSGMTMSTFSPTGYGSGSTWRLRNFYFYNSSGSLVGQYRTGNMAGYTGPIPGWQSPSDAGSYAQANDNALSGPTSNFGAQQGSTNNPPAAGWQSGSAQGALTTNPCYIKAF